MASEKINFKQRSPTVWLFLSLIPFVYFYWLASSRKQINQLNGDGKDAPQIRMSHWWTISLFLIGIVLVTGAFVFAIAKNIDTEGYSVSPLPAASASAIVARGDDPYDFHPTTTVVVDEGNQSFVDPYVFGAQAEDTVTGDEIVFMSAYFLGALTLLAFSIVHFFYLLQHTDGIVRLAGSDQDKTSLIVMSAIGCFVFGGLLLGVVHKSQSVINQAIGKLD